MFLHRGNSQNCILSSDPAVLHHDQRRNASKSGDFSSYCQIRKTFDTQWSHQIVKCSLRRLECGCRITTESVDFETQLRATINWDPATYKYPGDLYIYTSHRHVLRILWYEFWFNQTVFLSQVKWHSWLLGWNPDATSYEESMNK